MGNISRAYTDMMNRLRDNPPGKWKPRRVVKSKPKIEDNQSERLRAMYGKGEEK